MVTNLTKRKAAVASVVAMLLFTACGGSVGDGADGVKSGSAKGSTQDRGKGRGGKPDSVRIRASASDKPDDLGGVDGGAGEDKPEESAGALAAGLGDKPDEVAGSPVAATAGDKPGDAPAGGELPAAGIESGIAATSGLAPVIPAGPK